VDIVTALAQLQSFNHHACDTLLVSRHIELVHTLLKHGSSNEGIYGGSIVSVVWTSIVVGATARGYLLRRAGNLKPRRAVVIWGGFLCVLAAFSLWLQSSAVIEYVTACRSLLAIR
jgi:hypothetical protein